MRLDAEYARGLVVNGLESTERPPGAKYPLRRTRTDGRRDFRPVTLIAPEKAPTEAVTAREPDWCPHSLWDEGVFLCEREVHPPGTHHWYDTRKASQPAVEQSA